MIQILLMFVAMFPCLVVGAVYGESGRLGWHGVGLLNLAFYNQLVSGTGPSEVFAARGVERWLCLHVIFLKETSQLCCSCCISRGQSGADDAEQRPIAQSHYFRLNINPCCSSVTDDTDASTSPPAMPQAKPPFR